MYLARKADLFMDQWKADPDHKPMIISGPRQVGKTETVRAFARRQYQHLVEINFVEKPQYKSIVENGYEVDSILKSISLMDPGKPFVPGKTLLFFDEIQAFPDIATALKFFREDGRFDVICSGSLLGTHYHQIDSNSVGYKVDYQMTSLDFEEFLWAKGYDDRLSNNLLEHMVSLTPFTNMELDRCDSLFLDFAILGGMPEVVANYIKKGTFEGSLALQRQLLKDYEEDVRKYAIGVDQTRVLNVFRSIAPQLAKENKKFQLSKVKKGARFKDYRGCVDWLAEAGVVTPCYCMNFPELPIRGNLNPDKFKLYFFDTGMLIAMLDDETQANLRLNQNLGGYKGALYENMVGEALKKSGFDLCYYQRENSTLEEDFFIRNTNSLIPVEVKSTNSKSKSLRTLISSPTYSDISHGIKLIRGNIGQANDITTFPYFCTFLLKRYIQETSK